MNPGQWPCMTAGRLHRLSTFLLLLQAAGREAAEAEGGPGGAREGGQVPGALRQEDQRAEAPAGD
jgi:hypothetical protein